MQLKTLQLLLQQYKEFLRTPAAEDNLYIWVAQRHFQDHWDLDAPDLAAMYDQSLYSPHTKRLWKRESYEPKQVMLELIRLEPDFARRMFTELFREEQSVEGRLGRFVFYCDELLRGYKDANPRSIENNHYHDDYWMAFLYLAFRYPDRYTLYDFDCFRNVLEQLKAPNLPRTHDPERFVKVSRIIHQFMAKDEELTALDEQRLQHAKGYVPGSWLAVYDFYRFAGRGR